MKRVSRMIEYTRKPASKDIGVKKGSKKNQYSRLCTQSPIKAGRLRLGWLTASVSLSWSPANRADVCNSRTSQNSAPRIERTIMPVRVPPSGVASP